jgi:AAA+ superfamily predicted ATPase
VLPEVEGRIKTLEFSMVSGYRTLLKKDTLYPILVFNEADAVFDKRKDIGQSGVGQTENAIQNIILQELEDFEGILIATTNMTQNFDKAFERRFLYKILFNKPDEATRAKIWEDKIPGLLPQQAAILAKKYNISGGSSKM